ncbi:MAG TPA: hypothetical protein PK307_11860 [Spirochaetota bacterium]|nr:hypothetical protein [Spirochaetota bacterium]HOD14244.1 hypothetical protein [Spirochaetota bacterium]HPG50686.1 hypothetical protein [Spirochaetota bacterium]HPO46706.1 hypothetical protein [Spirochaetota bacterium]HQL82894.1 hypothetical protein [Spirochaetota bacterium]
MIQLLKLLLLAAFIYVIITMARFLIRTGRLAEERRKRENIREKDPGPKKREGVIELDKDDYKVE